MEILILLGLIALILSLIYSREKRRKDMLDKLNSDFGAKPKCFFEEFDMGFVKKYYEARKENQGVKEEIDELTWNDLEMNNVFKRTNYTSTTLGETYLYYKYRVVNYDSDEWEVTEDLINKFMKNSSLRNNVKLELQTLGKINDDRFIDFIYRPTFNKIKGFYKYPLLVIGLLLSIILILFTNKIGIILTLFFICANILIYQGAKTYLEENFSIMIYLLNNIKLCQKLSKIKDKDFENYSRQIEQVLSKFTKLKKVEKLSFTLSKRGTGVLSDLDLVIEYIKMFFMVDIIAYENIVKILETNKENLYLIYDLIARLDFALSLAYYRKSIDEYVNPEFCKENIIEIENIYHPLIDNPINNTIRIDKNIIFTGSNASGKSTFIKAIALNCIMAQSLNTALCSKYRGRFSKVITSMAIKDDILEGDSYFIAEIKSLKRLLDSLDNNIPILAFIDEILRGTNTVERIAASAAILKYGSTTDARILVATHDIELTQMIEKGYDNYHFREIVTDHEVDFDYKLKYGPSTTRNAIKLLKVMEFENEIVNEADLLCDSFVRDEKWPKI